MHNWPTRRKNLLLELDLLPDPDALSRIYLGHPLDSVNCCKLDKDNRESVKTLAVNSADFISLGILGEGQYGKVLAVKCNLDNRLYALKVVNKAAAARAGLQLNLSLERHIHLVARGSSADKAPSLVAAFQTDTELYLSTTLAPCGSLYDRLGAGCLSEDETRWWAVQMVMAMTWLHDQSFVHRDIKPHNFVVDTGARLRLTDFGSAAMLHSGKVDLEACLLPAGTPDYIAPEVLLLAEQLVLDDVDSFERHETYGVAVDWWSFGCTIFELATGEAPFYAPTVKETYDRIISVQDRKDMAKFGLSSGLGDLLANLLCPSCVRIALPLVQRHAFFQSVDWLRPDEAIFPDDFSIPLPLQLDDETSVSASAADFTFDHFFQSSLPASNLQRAHSTRWDGWSWIPPTDAFRDLHTPTPQTPARSTTFGKRGTTPRRAPTTAARGRSELVSCVQASAKKHVAGKADKLEFSRYPDTHNVDQLISRHVKHMAVLSAMQTGLDSLRSKFTSESG